MTVRGDETLHLGGERTSEFFTCLYVTRTRANRSKLRMPGYAFTYAERCPWCKDISDYLQMLKFHLETLRNV